ncbi:MAG: DUF3298 and DUF4163 domain-containing protein [Pyrinomonadaceae bacterium]|nr:DUF3298 and DUF4163 domain-containing protein [Pyrinomonadaceae bacterium]
MKIQKIALIVGLISIFGNIGCSQTTKNSNIVEINKNANVNQKVSTPNEQLNEIEETEKFNKFFSGSIGDEVDEKSKVYPFQMRLQRNGNQLAGKYRYANSKTDILLKGTIQDDNNFLLNESADGKNTGKFEGKLEPDSDELFKMSGTWTKAGSEDFVGFSAEEIQIEMTGDVYVQDVTIKDKSKGFDISINYPQFSGKDFSALNLSLKNIGTKYLQDFKKYKPVNGGENYLEAGYRIEFANDNLVAISFSDESYTGGAHPNHYTQTFNFDLKNKKRILLNDIFNPNTKYLQKLSQLSKAELGENLEFEDGIKPIAKNFSNFSLIKKGLLIYFNEYQVAPYVSGRQEIIISFDDLKDFMKKTDLLKF